MKPNFTRFNPTAGNRSFSDVPAGGYVDGVDSLHAQQFNALVAQHNDWIHYIQDDAADEFYVSNTGSDSTGDGTSGNPFRTLQKCFDSSMPFRPIQIRCQGTFISNADAVTAHKNIEIIATDIMGVQYNTSGRWFSIATTEDCNLKIDLQGGCAFDNVPGGDNGDPNYGWIIRQKGSLNLVINGNIEMPADTGTGSTNLIMHNNNVSAGSLNVWIDGKVTTHGANGRVLNPSGTHSKIASQCSLQIDRMNDAEKFYALRDDNYVLKCDIQSLAGNFYVESSASNLPNAKTEENDRDITGQLLKDRVEALVVASTGKDVVIEIRVVKDLVSGDVWNIEIETFEELPFGIYTAMAIDYPNSNDGRFFTWEHKRNTILKIENFD